MPQKTLLNENVTIDFSDLQKLIFINVINRLGTYN